PTSAVGATIPDWRIRRQGSVENTVPVTPAPKPGAAAHHAPFARAVVAFGRPICDQISIVNPTARQGTIGKEDAGIQGHVVSTGYARRRSHRGPGGSRLAWPTQAFGDQQRVGSAVRDKVEIGLRSIPEYSVRWKLCVVTEFRRGHGCLPAANIDNII